MSSSDALVSKGEFAALCNVSPGRVTQWINERKLTGEALVGEGRSAKIRVEVAQRQLKNRRDVGQALGNGLDTRLDGKRPKPAPPDIAPDEEEDAALDIDAASDDQIDVAIKRAKLRALRSAQRKTDEDEALRQGRFVEAMAVRRQMGLVAAQTMRVFEGALPEIATALAAQFSITDREVLQLLNEMFRSVRSEAAKKAVAAAELLPSLVPDASGAATES